MVSVIRVSGQWWVLAHCSQSDHVASQAEGSSCTTATNGFKKSLDLARTLMRAAPQPNSPCLSAPHTRGHVTGNGNVQDRTRQEVCSGRGTCCCCWFRSRGALADHTCIPRLPSLPHPLLDSASVIRQAPGTSAFPSFGRCPSCEERSIYN